MTLFLLVKVASALVSLGLAAGILARDHGLRANQLMAGVLFCNAYWAIWEFVLYQTTDPQMASFVYRAMTLGWVPLGILCAHATIALAPTGRHAYSRFLPAAYFCTGTMVLIGVGTDWVIIGAEKTQLGWRALFGPGMIAAYGCLAVPVLAMLRHWRRYLRIASQDGPLRLARIVFFGVSGALLAGTLTAVVLPVLGIDSVGITTTLLALVGLAAGHTLYRFGHALISPEAFAREILDTLEDGVILVGESGEIRDANRAFLRLAGVRDVSALGRRIECWLPGFAEKAKTSEPASVMELTTASGERIPVVLSASVDGVGHGSEGLGRVYLVRDRREVVALERQLLVSARLAAVGDLTRPISRAIAEPVATTRGELEGLALDWQTVDDILELRGLRPRCEEAADEGMEMIAECIEGIERISSVVREVAGFSSDKEETPSVRSRLDRIVSLACRVAGAQAPEHVEIETRLDSEVYVDCRPEEVERVVVNLVINSIHSFQSTGHRAGHIAVAVARQDDRALLHVEDDGCGIESEVLDRIFDPFFTTKPVGSGTGLGLAICHHIIEAHGGEIRVSSVPGRGTSVAVALPILRETESPRGTASE